MGTTNDTAARKIRRAWCQAWNAIRLHPTARAILTALYKRLGDDLFCRPGQARIAQDAGISERTVRRWLPRLERDRWIWRQERVCKRGRLPDLYDIRTPECADITTLKPVYEPTGQNGQGCPDKLAGGKGSIGKALETSSKAASWPGLAARERSTQDKAIQDALVQDVPVHLAQFAKSWRELVGKTPQPSAAWLDTYSPREVQTALAVLLVRLRTGEVKSPKGLFKHLLEATHAGEREPRAYSPDELRRIAQGQLPEHTRTLRRQPTPEVPEYEASPATTASIEAVCQESGQESSQAKEHSQVTQGATQNLATTLIAGHGTGCGPGQETQNRRHALEALEEAVEAGKLHILDAIEAMAGAWGWSPYKAQWALAGVRGERPA